MKVRVLTEIWQNSLHWLCCFGYLAELGHFVCSIFSLLSQDGYLCSVYSLSTWNTSSFLCQITLTMCLLIISARWLLVQSPLQLLLVVIIIHGSTTTATTASTSSPPSSPSRFSSSARVVTVIRSSSSSVLVSQSQPYRCSHRSEACTGFISPWCHPFHCSI